MSGRRFLERDDIKRLIGQARDFTIRWQGMQVILVGSGLIISISALLLLWNAVQMGYHEPSFVMPLFMLIAVTIGLVIVFHQCFQRVTYIEFLSLLFASSARVDCEFMMILNRRGIVVYCDDNYDRLFKELADLRDFQEFMAHEGLKKEHADGLVQALMDRKDASVPFQYQDNEGKKVKVQLELSPLMRPANYSVLKAKKIT